MVIDKNKFLKKIKRNITIHPETGCWLWNGTCNNGYGQTVIYKRHREYVHRLICYIFHNLDLEDLGQMALHKLECKYRRCCNPDHLYVGSQEQNENDKLILGNNVNASKTHCKRGHEFTPLNTRFWNGQRACKQCLRMSNNKYRQKKLMVNKKLGESNAV